MLLIASFTFTTRYSSNVRILLELIPIAMAIYPITVTIYFCINCCVVSNVLRLINIQIMQLYLTPSTNSSFGTHLKFLQKQHFTICQSIELLKESFGPALFFEILFLFVGLTNTIMRIVLQSRNITHVYGLVMAVSTIIDNTVTLLFICHSAESIRSQVKMIYYL